MKKVILILLTILTYSACAQAQIIETDSKMRTVIKEPEKPKAPRFNYFTVKIGGGMFKDDDSRLYSTEAQFKGCCNIELGFIHIMNNNGVYLGGEIGGIIANLYRLTPVYFQKKDRFRNGLEFHIGPTLGIIRPIKENMEFDGHIGIGYGYSKVTPTNFLHSEIGTGLWYKRYFAGIEVQAFSSSHNTDLGILINLGIRF